MADRDRYDKLRKEFNPLKVHKGVLKGTKIAIRNAGKFTRNDVRKDLRRELGVQNKRIKGRVLQNKPASGLTGRHSLKGGIAVAVLKLMPMRWFKPKQKIVKTQISGSKSRKKVKRFGATIKIGKKPRELVPGGKAFLMDVGATQIVAERKGRSRRPTRQLYTKVLQEVVANMGSSWQKLLQKRFEQWLKSEAFDKAIEKEIK